MAEPSKYREMGWDEGFDKDFSENDFIVLPEGDYDFTVESFERGRYDGGEFMPPCPKATMRLGVETPDGPASVTLNLFLCSKDSCRRMIYRFFESIGQVKDGEPLRPSWGAGALVGQTGRAHIIQRADRNDPSKVYNNVKSFYPKEPKKFTPGKF